MAKRLKQDNSLVQKIIKEIANELNLSEDVVYNAIQHFFVWQRKAFNELNYSKYLWNYFGTFSIMEKRHEQYVQKQEQKQLDKLTNQNNKDNGEEKRTN